MASFTVSPTDITNAEALLVQVMKDKYPELDWAPGSALRDLIVKTLAYGLAYVQSIATGVEKRSSLDTLAGLTDQIAINAADALISNFLITRKTGGASSGVISVYLSDRVDVLVRAADRFYKTVGNGFHLTSQIDTVIPSSQLHAVTDADGNELEFWFNIPVTADNAESDLSVPAGTWESWSSFNAYVTRVENLSDFAEGTGPETNEDLIARARNAITVRNLINLRSVDSVLRDNFATVYKTMVTGASDPEMQRDRIEIADWGIDLHVLGHMDMWVWLPLVEDQTLNQLIGATLTIPLSPLGEIIYRVSRAYYIGVGPVEVDLTYTNEDVPANSTYRIVYADPDLAYSLSQDVKVLVGPDMLGKTIYLEYDTVSGFKDVNDFAVDDSRRIICANPLVRAAIPVYVNTIILYVVKEDATETLDEAAVAAGVASLINSHTGDLYASTIIAYVMDNWGHIIENVRTPLDINYTLWSTEGLRVDYTTTNKVEIVPANLVNFEVDPYPVPGLFSMSTRNMRFIASASDITVNLDAS